MRSKSRGNGQGTAYKRGNTWTAQVVIGFHPNSVPGRSPIPIKRTKGGFPTKKAALAYCPTLLNGGVEKTEKAPRLSAYWDTYNQGEYKRLSDSKQTAYKIAWDKLKTLHDVPIDLITVDLLRSTVSAACTTYYPARDCRSLLANLYKIAAAEGRANKDLPSFIVLPKLNETEREPFTEAEQTALWTAWERGCADAAIPLIMIYTGLMTGEMRRLRTDMINFETREIHGVGLKTQVRKKSAVFFPSSLIPILQAVTLDKVGLVWSCSEDEFYRRYYHALEMAGTRKLTPYSCRHTTATALAVTEGIAPQTVKKIMRWSTTKMLDRYAHPDASDALEAVDTLRKAT